MSREKEHEEKQKKKEGIADASSQPNSSELSQPPLSTNTHADSAVSEAPQKLANLPSIGSGATPAAQLATIHDYRGLTRVQALWRGYMQRKQMNDFGWSTATEDDVDKMTASMTVRSTRFQRSVEQVIQVKDHKINTMASFCVLDNPPRAYFGGTKVSCSDDTGVRVFGMALFTYCGRSLTKGSKLLIVLLSLCPVRYLIPSLKSTSDCLPVLPIQRCRKETWDLASRLPALMWISKRHADIVFQIGVPLDMGEDCMRTSSITPKHRSQRTRRQVEMPVSTLVAASPFKKPKLEFECKADSCEASFATGNGCNTHMRSHTGLTLEPYEKPNSRRGSKGAGKKNDARDSESKGKADGKPKRYSLSRKPKKETNEEREEREGRKRKQAGSQSHSPSPPVKVRDRQLSAQADSHTNRQTDYQSFREADAARANADAKRFLQVQGPLLNLLHYQISRQVAAGSAAPNPAPSLLEGPEHTGARQEYMQTSQHYAHLRDLTFEDFCGMPAKEWQEEAKQIPLSLGHKKVFQRLHTSHKR